MSNQVVDLAFGKGGGQKGSPPSLEWIEILSAKIIFLQKDIIVLKICYHNENYWITYSLFKLQFPSGRGSKDHVARCPI